MAKTVGNTTGQPNDYTVDTGSGITGTDTQRMVLATDDPAVTSLAIMDDWDDGSDRAKVVGAVAQDAAVAGNPVLSGGRASAAAPSAMSADGDSVFQWLSTRGAVIVHPFRNFLSVTPTISTSPAYTALDQAGGVQTITNAALFNGGSGGLINVTVTDRDTDLPNLALHIYQNTPSTPAGDNAAYSFTDANTETAIYFGTLYFTSWENFGANRGCGALWRGMPLSRENPLEYTCASGSTSIFALAQFVSGAWTPASTTDLVFNYLCVQDA